MGENKGTSDQAEALLEGLALREFLEGDTNLPEAIEKGMSVAEIKGIPTLQSDVEDLGNTTQRARGDLLRTPPTWCNLEYPR